MENEANSQPICIDAFVADPPKYYPHKINFRVEELREEDRKKHDTLVSLIAQNRFAYPSKVSPSLATFVNSPKRVLSVAVSDSESICPDIVVVNKVTKKAATIAEVETQMTIDNERAVLWSKYATVRDANFYLYIPQSELTAVKQLIRFFRARVTGIRVYSYNNFGEPIISNV